MTTPQPWWALVGVIVGFGLGEGTRYLRYRWEIYRNRRLVKEELKAVLAQLPQKMEILSKAIASLRKQRTLSTQSVHLITTGYTAVLDDLYPHLSLKERNCLHVIYERLRVADETVDGFENQFLEILRNGQIEDPWNSYADRMADQLESLKTVEELAQSYVKDNAVDVFGVDRK